MRGGGGSPRNTYGGRCTEQRLLFTPGSPWPVVVDPPSLPPVSLVPPPKDPPHVPYAAAPSSPAVLVPAAAAASSRRSCAPVAAAPSFCPCSGAMLPSPASSADLGTRGVEEEASD
jgi:hypothetical protein